MGLVLTTVGLDLRSLRWDRHRVCRIARTNKAAAGLAPSEFAVSDLRVAGDKQTSSQKKKNALSALMQLKKKGSNEVQKETFSLFDWP